MAQHTGGGEGKRYYRIGEVSRITGVKPYVLRYWENEFHSLLPRKTRSNQRLYRRSDIDAILLIRRLLWDERYTIAGAKQRLRELGAGRRAAAALGGEPRNDLRRIRESLRELRETLE